MNLIKPINVLGVMSSTSYEDVYLSLICTDGIDVYDFLAHQKIPYSEDLRKQIKSIVGIVDDEKARRVDENLTDFYIEIIKEFMENHQLKIDLIGLEGQTIYCNMNDCYLKQIGNPQKLADAMNIDVVSNFHNADILSGGQGFPLTPSFYSALMNEVEKPAVVINLSGVASVFWVGEHGEMCAFDAGPCNLAINTWTQKHGGMHMDYNGKLAITGKADEKIVATMMKHKFFAKYPPKSLPNSVFLEKMEHLEGLSLEDGAATLTSFIAEALTYSILMYLPAPPKNIAICGGGVRNPTLVRFVRQKLAYLGASVKTSDDIGLKIDALDGGAIAFLAARRLNFLPISYPATTGVLEPLIGGELVKAQNCI